MLKRNANKPSTKVLLDKLVINARETQSNKSLVNSYIYGADK
jgi:hypothetical protein